jgi:hypothetical protein
MSELKCSLLKFNIKMRGLSNFSWLQPLHVTSGAMGQNTPSGSSFVQRVIAWGLGLYCLADAVPTSTVNARSQTSYTPVAFGVGTAPIIDGLQTYSGSEVILTPSAPVVTLDYGADVAGFPYFEVTSVTGSAVQVELKYSEQFPGLNLDTGDGPL